ncbi:MAG: hypothetical protein CL666_04905 [Balneola sp.]|nr:hypothetical protein [Balneola sp.]|tara:strand:+ start:34883 stop:36004 length:1122 start_codon:yes stop_codon:yes gene_type:complete
MGKSEWLKVVLFFGILISLMGACNESQELQPNVDIQELDVKIPAKISTFSQLDTLYYSFLGLNSLPTQDGGFILPLWGPPTLVKTNAEGSVILARTQEGRGPGELLDVGIPSLGKNEVYVFDQNQDKIVIYDANSLSLINEFLAEAYPEYKISRVYPSFEAGSVLLELSNAQLEIAKMQEKLLIKFDIENKEYGESIPIKGEAYAPLGELINGRSGTAMKVPFSDKQLITPAPERGSLLLFDTRTNLIAEINANFDTLNTIRVDLPTESVSAAEKDSIKNEVESFQSADWSNMEPYIPDEKAVANNMLFNNDKIWLKSNNRGKGDIWYVLNMQGVVTDVIQLPANTFLAHVSDDHLGVRMDQVTFALYENPLP